MDFAKNFEFHRPTSVKSRSRTFAELRMAGIDESYSGRFAVFEDRK